MKLSLAAFVAFLLSALLQICNGAAVGIRGKESLELNCPSIPYKFPQHSTLRCESCKTIGRVLHYSIVHYYRQAEDMLISGPTQMGPELCVITPIVTELRQKTNGRRFWDLTRLMKDGDQIEYSPYVDNDYDPLPAADLAEAKKSKGPKFGFGANPVEDTQTYPDAATNDKAMSVNNRRATYHTKEERETLPCANYFLKRYCLTEYLGEDETSDAVDGCVEAYNGARKVVEEAIKVAVRKRQDERRANNEEPLDPVALEEEERRRQKYASDQHSSSLLQCLTGKICGSLVRGECDSRSLIEMQKGEREDFLKYEATHGNSKHPYVGTALDARKLERNPYARSPSSSKSTEL
eukprot:GILI01025511.1.p1 GENE.GILI01025511.1~~GILI01025511.1.p1  ORF type:complete len:361 (-),score=37.81 GILI01025511.1:96-1148(-)